MPSKTIKNVDITRTPLDTLDEAIADIDRQNSQLEATLKVNRRLKEGLTVAKEKALQAFQNHHISLLPKPPQSDSNRMVGFLGAGLAARVVEVLEDRKGSMHIDDIFAVVSSMPGLASLSKESLRATMNSDCKRKFPRIVNLGQAIYDLATKHPKQRHSKPKQLAA